MFDIERWLRKSISQPKENTKIFSDKHIFTISIVFSVCLILSIVTPFYFNNGIPLITKFLVLISSILITSFAGLLINLCWKKYPYMVKSSMIAGGIAMLFNILFNLCTIAASNAGSNIDNYPNDILCIVFLIPEFSSFWLLYLLNIPESIPEAYWTILGTCVWFFLGLVIGFIIDYIKKEPTDVSPV